MRKSIIQTAILVFLSSYSLAGQVLDGTYYSNCLPMGSGHEESFKAEIKILQKTAKANLYFYSDKTCGFESFKLNYVAEINYPEEVSAGPFDQRIQNGFFVQKDPQFLKNKGSQCQNFHFTLGKENNLKALGDCAPLSIPGPGKILFDIFEQQGAYISFGAFPLLWITDEEKRPALMGGVRLKRQ